MSQNDLILAALRSWIRQRPGLDFGNYGGAASYRAESRRITRQRHDAERLIDAAEMSGPHSDQAWRDAFRAFSGRLTWDADRRSLSYVTGQYWPTEYRAAVCAVVASLLWARYRDAMPPPRAYVVTTPGRWNGQTWTRSQRLSTHPTEAEAEVARPDREHGVRPVYGTAGAFAGDYLRAQFVNRFGRSLAGRWFR